MSGSILDEIFAARKLAVAEDQKNTALAQLEKRVAAMAPTKDLRMALASDPPSILAEIKKGSPSRGILREPFDPVDLALAYQQGGAAALSVVTEPEFFWGDIQWLPDIRKATSLPLLRKDFVFCEYQLWQSRAAGADAVLLILAMLSDHVVSELLNRATDIGLQCLVEVHDAEEAGRAANLGADLVGVNNRNLKTFEVNLETAFELAPLLPQMAVKVAESGIFDAIDCHRLQAEGYQAFLIGEALVTSDQPAHKIQSLRQGTHAD